VNATPCVVPTTVPIAGKGMTGSFLGTTTKSRPPCGNVIVFKKSEFECNFLFAFHSLHQLSREVGCGRSYQSASLKVNSAGLGAGDSKSKSAGSIENSSHLGVGWNGCNDGGGRGEGKWGTAGELPRMLTTTRTPLVLPPVHP